MNKRKELVINLLFCAILLSIGTGFATYGITAEKYRFLITPVIFLAVFIPRLIDAISIIKEL